MSTSLLEQIARRPRWTEGTWITLVDGQAWCFPPCEVVPGITSRGKQAAREIANDLISVANVEGMQRHIDSLVINGDPSGLLASFSHMLAIYQGIFRIASDMLAYNYDLPRDDFERLMPFNYQVDEIRDPMSNLNTATPQLLAVCNKIATILPVDLNAEFQRMGQCN